MKITEGTKISELIKFNPESIEVIASINRHFEKLRNPLLRKILASRVTIRDAAKIGHCHVDVFFEKLQEIGFSRTTEAEPEIKTEPSVFSIPKNAKVVTLDVREEIDKGKDPFLNILNTLEKLSAGEYLALINSFEPMPLISILSKKNYPCHVVHEKDVVITYISKLPESKPLRLVKDDSQQKFEEKLLSFGANIKSLDVSAMEMPGPMITILKTLEDLPSGFGLHVFHRRIPRFLLPELNERGFDILMKENGSDSVELLIFK